MDNSYCFNVNQASLYKCKVTKTWIVSRSSLKSSIVYLCRACHLLRHTPSCQPWMVNSITSVSECCVLRTHTSCLRNSCPDLQRVIFGFLRFAQELISNVVVMFLSFKLDSLLIPLYYDESKFGCSLLNHTTVHNYFG